MDSGAWIGLIVSVLLGLVGLVVLIALVCHCGRHGPPRWPYALAAVIAGLAGAAGGVCLAAMGGAALYSNSQVAGKHLGLDSGLGQLAFMGVLALVAFMGVLALVAGVPIGAGMGGWVGVWVVEMARGEQNSTVADEG